MAKNIRESVNFLVISSLTCKFILFYVAIHYFQAAKTSCSGDYVNVDSSNDACISDIDAIDAVRKRLLYIIGLIIEIFYGHKIY